MRITYHKIKSAQCQTFQYGDDPDLIHVIKTGFDDRYIVVFEDAYEMVLGQTEILNKDEVEIKFKIKL